MLEYADNELDELLFLELSKLNPDEQFILDLLKEGANVNCIRKYGESVLIHAIGPVREGLDIKFIKILIDASADLNFQINGYNCLYYLNWILNLITTYS